MNPERRNREGNGKNGDDLRQRGFCEASSAARLYLLQFRAAADLKAEIRATGAKVLAAKAKLMAIEENARAAEGRLRVLALKYGITEQEIQEVGIAC